MGKGSAVWRVLLGLALGLSAAPTASAGPIDRAGDALRGDGGGSSGGSSDDDDDGDSWGLTFDGDERYESHPRYEDGDDGLDALAFQVIFAPWTVPNALTQHFHPDFDGFELYPYADEEEGGVGRQRKPYAGKVGVAYTPAFNNVDSATLSAQLDFELPFALRGQYRGFLERFAAAGERSRAGLGEVEALFRFAQAPRIQFHSGVAYTNWIDGRGMVHGVLFSYGFDSYPLWPLTFGGRVSIGPVGESYIFQARGYLGVMVGRTEVQVAYDHVDVGGVPLGGLSLAAQVHF